MNTTAITVVIEIAIDSSNDTYKTKSFLEVGEEYAKKSEDIPRDVLLSMLYELRLMASRVMKKAEISNDEMDEYLTQRKLVTQIDNDEPPSRGKGDIIDQSINNLFGDDE
ncbi:MAG TPA: hypothetical protein VI911_10095 [Patescibacteria group bacterium]|nr:hypothetical protein [Patescibacteria group bacterium]